jgi:hypothetical protein
MLEFLKPGDRLLPLLTRPPFPLNLNPHLLHSRFFLALVTMATIKASPFKLALVQVGILGKDKTRNLANAREMVLQAAQGQDGLKADLVVLPVSQALGLPSRKVGKKNKSSASRAGR